MNGGRDITTVTMSILRMRRTASLVGVLLSLWGLFFSLEAYAQSPKGRNALVQVQDRHRDRFREFSKQIKKLADECDEKKLVEEAIQIRSRAFVPDTDSLHVDKLPSVVRPKIPSTMKGEDRHWTARLRSLETDYAKDLYFQSMKALDQGYPSYAYDLVREAALHDPDHDKARKILGFVRLKNEWVTPFAYNQIRQQNVWNEKFGWLPKSQEQRYKAGERYLNGHWYSEEKERELRRDFNSAWRIQTDHYLIITNVSLERGVEMGKALEDFHRVFNETFAGFFNTPEQLVELFKGTGKTVRGDAKPYKVHFYRTREEYLERLRKFFPSIDQTNGVYLTTDRTAHFYLDPKQDHEGTLFHEATHQLFFESHLANRTICENHHFWIIEGIACYMESFQRKDGSFSLGDPNHIRFRGARHNLLQEKYYVPMREFSGYGMQDFQNVPKPDLIKNYTQASGLARFFMNYDKGRYREALVKHLAQLYSNDKTTREQAQGLDELTGVDFGELDRQYAEDARDVEAQAQLQAP
jgi:hypothetical protein